MNITRKTRLLAFSALPVLTACGDSIPQATDEQLLTLLGNSREVRGEQLPPSIPRSVEECVRLLSGLEDEVVKDIPAEFLGQMKAECRSGLRNHLEDPERNPMGLELAHFDERELGERISDLAEPSREAAQQAATEAQERYRQAQIDDAKEAVAGLLSSLDERLATFNNLCSELSDSREAAQAQGISLPTNLRYYTPPPCNGHYAEQLRTQAENLEERLSSIQPSTGSLFLMPHLGAADPERLDGFQEDLESSIQEIQGLLQDS
ncbi:hypothetical protein [Halomonas sp. 328]|uniref:hypothetical protein n=1 Tax=Halomonas sp. 328 TaxID=2776704 RepID=UPI0018A775FF|nr:hypothetical protein [Halomonas sp. 328]MBF8222384.1 hypothetical protein [Halomonas sp. 328]